MTLSASATNQKIYWLVSLGIVLQLMARQVVPEGPLRIAVLLIAAAMNLSGLYLIFKNDWLELKPLFRKIRARW